MKEITSTAVVQHAGKSIRIVADQSDFASVTLRLSECQSECTGGRITLDPPFRAELDSSRLIVVVQLLLSHDYLLSKKLSKGSELEFRVDLPKYGRVARLETVVSLSQESVISAKPGEKVLPWLLMQCDMSKLYPFQKEGVGWLLDAEGRLLADDMGLGKTVQTIFAVRHGFSEQLFNSVLVLCPKSLVLNWLSEFRRWAPELISLAVSPPARAARQVWAKAIVDSHVIITNYEQIRESPITEGKHRFTLVVADEAHRLRNSSSQVVQDFKNLERERLWALTGTPIERDRKDLATLMSLLAPKRFSVDDARTASAALREKAKPFVMRRTKASVMNDLPRVVTRVESLALYEAQSKTYRAVQGGVDCNGAKIKNALHKIGELRRVCDFDPVSKSSVKLDRIYEELLEVKAAGEKAIVFSFSLEPLEALGAIAKSLLGGIALHGQMDGSERSQAVNRFKSDPEVTVLYASSKVASEGLTLVEANHVFFINQWWNPSSNAQARDRVNRIGQKRCVFVHEYVCVGTVEESIQRLLSTKGRLYKDLIGRLEDVLLGDANLRAHLDGKAVT